MKSTQLAAAAAVTASHSMTAQAVKTAHFPLYLSYGPNEKISTIVEVPATKASIPVVYDSGSENFFVFGPGSYDAWGTSAIGVQGRCRKDVPAGLYFDNQASSTASEPVDHTVSFVYGGADKIYQGNVTVNDTLSFSNSLGSETLDNVRVQLMHSVTLRINDANCTGNPLYDTGIMGISPYYNDAKRKTQGPSVRQDLLERGAIEAATQSMWFDEAPATVTDTYTGSGLQGGIDTSKYSGDLVKVKSVKPEGLPGYFTAVPTVTVGGVTFKQPENQEYCQLDSGTHDDTVPVHYEQMDAFFNATGIVITPKGYIAWPGKCDTIPADAGFDLTFPGAEEGKSVTIRIPIRAYARFDFQYLDPGYCYLSVGTSGCFLGGPFAIASYFAADDERGEIALAQGGVSKAGSGIDEANVVLRIP